MLLLIIVGTSCKKEEPQPETVIVQRYATDVLHANYNEPKTNYWFVYEESQSSFYFAVSTDYSRDVSTLNFQHDKKFPVDIYKANGRRLNDVQVLKSIIIKP